MDSRVAKRYSRALFNVAKKMDVIQSVEEDLTSIRNLIHQDERFESFLLSPNVSREEKVKIAERLFSDRITALTMQFLRVLLEKRRESEVVGVHDEFVRLRREEGNVFYADVVSAESLSDQQQVDLVKKLEKISGKQVEAEFRVDTALIGGIRVQYGNFVLDGSIRGSLNRLKDTLRRDLLKQA